MPIGISNQNNDISTYASFDPSPMEVYLNITIINYNDYPSVKYAIIEALTAPSAIYMNDPLNDGDNASWLSDPIEINSDGTFSFQDAMEGLYEIFNAGRPWTAIRIHFSESSGINSFKQAKYAPVVIYLTSVIENITNDDDEQSFNLSYRVMISPSNKMITWGTIFYQMFVSSAFNWHLYNNMLERDICMLKYDFDNANTFENTYNGNAGYWNRFASSQLLPSSAWRYCSISTISSVIDYYNDANGYGYEPTLNPKITGGMIYWNVYGKESGYGGNFYLFDGITSSTLQEIVYVPSYTNVEIMASPVNSSYTIESSAVTINVENKKNINVRFKAYKTSTKDKVTLKLNISNTSGNSYRSNTLTIYNRSSKDATEKGTQVATYSFMIMRPFDGGIVTATTQIEVSSIQNTGYWYGVITNGPATLINPYLQQETHIRQTIYTLHMNSAGTNRINVIRYLNSNMGMTYKEAKNLCDTAPNDIITTTSYTQANTWKTGLTNLGATISINTDTQWIVDMPKADKTGITAELSVTTGITTGSTTGETVSGGRNYIIQIDNKRMKDNGDNRGIFSWYVQQASYKESTAVLSKNLPYAIEFIVSNWNSSSLSYADGIGENYVYTLEAKQSEGTLYAGAFVFSNGKSGTITYNYFHDNIIIQNTEATNVKHSTSYGLYTETSFDIGDDSFVLYYNS